MNTVDTFSSGIRRATKKFKRKHGATNGIRVTVTAARRRVIHKLGERTRSS